MPAAMLSQRPGRRASMDRSTCGGMLEQNGSVPLVNAGCSKPGAPGASPYHSWPLRYLPRFGKLPHGVLAIATIRNNFTIVANIIRAPNTISMPPPMAQYTDKSHPGDGSDPGALCE